MFRKSLLVGGVFSCPSGLSCLHVLACCRLYAQQSYCPNVPSVRLSVREMLFVKNHSTDMCIILLVAAHPISIKFFLFQLFFCSNSQLLIFFICMRKYVIKSEKARPIRSQIWHAWDKNELTWVKVVKYVRTIGNLVFPPLVPFHYFRNLPKL